MGDWRTRRRALALRSSSPLNGPRRNPARGSAEPRRSWLATHGRLRRYALFDLSDGGAAAFSSRLDLRP